MAVFAVNEGLVSSNYVPAPPAFETAETVIRHGSYRWPKEPGVYRNGSLATFDQRRRRPCVVRQNREHLGTAIAASLDIDQIQARSPLKRGGMSRKGSRPSNSYSTGYGFYCESRCFLGMLSRAGKCSQSSYSRAFRVPRAMPSNSSRQFLPFGNYDSQLLREAVALGTRRLPQILIL